ncbi:MAG: DNA-directed RNA polymerase subunit delta [Ureaplasma sp.]|nr:DNA-directed RNA polymerase subunit delta [Ureaplasma sp.]
MITKNINEIAYEIAKKDFKNKEFNFNDLVNKIIDKAEISKTEFNDQIGDFYTNLLQDVRFVFLGNNQWTLKENLKVAEYQIKMNSLYDFEQNDLVEDYEQNLIDSSENDEYKNDNIEDDDIDFEYDHAEEDIDDENFDATLDEESKDLESDINSDDEF